MLEQHLLRDEMIRPGTKQLGLFKGTEPVFPRSAVVSVKSEENYWRVGRVIKPDEIPMKWVKARVVTINKKRAEALAQMDGEEAQQQPLYALEQTEVYRPPAVENVSIAEVSLERSTPALIPHITGQSTPEQVWQH